MYLQMYLQNESAVKKEHFSKKMQIHVAVSTNTMPQIELTINHLRQSRRNPIMSVGTGSVQVQLLILKVVFIVAPNHR